MSRIMSLNQFNRKTEWLQKAHYKKRESHKPSLNQPKRMQSKAKAQVTLQNPCFEDITK